MTTFAKINDTYKEVSFFVSPADRKGSKERDERKCICTIHAQVQQILPAKPVADGTLALSYSRYLSRTAVYGNLADFTVCSSSTLLNPAHHFADNMPGLFQPCCAGDAVRLVRYAGDNVWTPTLLHILQQLKYFKCTNVSLRDCLRTFCPPLPQLCAVCWVH